MSFRATFCDGAKILDFHKKTIKKVSKEKKLEDSFLNNLLLNFCVVLILFLTILSFNTNSAANQKLNLYILFGVLLIYPFIFNTIVYLWYSLFGFVAEMLGAKDEVKSLLSVGFHSTFIYAIFISIIGTIMFWNSGLGKILFWIIILHFLCVTFASIKEIYKFSNQKTLMCIFVPFILLGVIFLALWLIFPSQIQTIFSLLV